MGPKTEKLVRAIVIVALGLLAGLLYFGARGAVPTRDGRGTAGACEGCPLAGECDRAFPPEGGTR